MYCATTKNSLRKTQKYKIEDSVQSDFKSNINKNILFRCCFAFVFFIDLWKRIVVKIRYFIIETIVEE